MMKPRTVVFLPNIPWSADAGQQAAHFRALGIAGKVINPTSKPWNPFAGMHPFLQGLDPWRALTVLTRHRRADAVVSVFESGALVLLALRWVFRFRPKVLLWDVANDGDWKLRNRVLDFVMPRVDGVMCLTSCQGDALQQRWQLKAPPRMVYYRIDEEDFAPAQAAEVQDYVLAVGKDISRDYATLLNAVAPCDLRLVVKTSLPLALPANARATLERLVGHLDVGALRQLYARARIVVLPLHQSIHPGGITCLFEAMAVGKPVVVTDSASIRDFVRHGQNALVVPCGDAVAMREAIRRLLGDHELQQALGRAARLTITERFSSRAFAERFSDALEAWKC